MAAAANYGQANRQLLTEAARVVLSRVAGATLDLVYDVSHNLAKIETNQVGGIPTRLCVHRKGSTRALPPGHPELPAGLADAGQPVLVPGSMGTSSGSTSFPSSQVFPSWPVPVAGSGVPADRP